MVSRAMCGVCIALVWGALTAGAAAQDSPAAPQGSGGQVDVSAAISGQVRRAGSMRPIQGATVLVEGTSIQATTDAQGRFTLPNVPAGAHHLIVAAPTFIPLRIDVTVGATPPPPLDILLAAEVHYTEVVSVSPNARDPFESYQPTSVLAGQQLTRELEPTLGATLERQPGVAQRSLGPGPSRPVIRGLDGDRVLILQDGQRSGDLSSQSSDHGVTINPASAARIEVVRGPATLLHGANAIGGLVNVITETVPTAPLEGTQGAVVVDFASGSRDFGTAADVKWGNGQWALHAGGSGRRSGDVATPEGRIDNTQSRLGSGSFGAAWTGTKGFFGGSYGYDDTRYGVPVIHEGEVELTPRRHLVAVKGGASELTGVIEGFRANFATRQYRHDEVVGDDIETSFENDTHEFDVLVRHRPYGRLSGTIGVWALNRSFAASGEEALSPPVKERGTAAFFYEELTWPHVTLQFGARVNHASFDPEEDLPSRSFTDLSSSAGLLFRPAAANDKLTIAINLARASRNPALEELYFFGPHAGNFAFEVGNSGLRSERALGLDLSLRWRAQRVHGEISYFRNAIADYIFRRPMTEEEFDERFGHDAHAGDDQDEHGHEEFGFIEFSAADSVLQGMEGHVDVELGRGLALELGLDYVRGTLRDSGEPLPRIPPFRFRGGLQYRRNAFTAGGEIVAVGRQDRVFDIETPTAGYGNLRLFTSYSFGQDRLVNTITARLENATNELYRNHLSFVKDIIPERGRNFRVVYALRF